MEVAALPLAGEDAQDEGLTALPRPGAGAEGRAAPAGRRPSDRRGPAATADGRPGTSRMRAGRGRAEVGTDARPPAERVPTRLEDATVIGPGPTSPARRCESRSTRS